MGLGGKFFANPRAMVLIAKISTRLDIHLHKKCAYCPLELGLGNEYPVVEFVEHLKEKHPEKIPEGDIKLYEKLIKRLS